MKVRRPSKYALFGISLALMLQTNYRFIGPVGVGELLMMAYFVMTLIGRVFSDRRLIMRKPDRLTTLYLGVVVMIIMPMTFLSSVVNTPGSNFRDLVAYLLVCAVLLALPSAERDIRTIVKTFLIALFLTICFQYVFGSASAYYSFRFTGGAKNPNQLALYLAAAVVFSAFLHSTLWRMVVSVLALFFGVMALSDAFLVFVFASLLVFVGLTIMPPRTVPYALPLILFLSGAVFFYSGVPDLLLQKWVTADEGGSRIQLYISAVYAWLDTPFSMLVGHGAGSFSGLGGPFEMAEAHNTALDLATVAGIFGLLLFPFLPLKIALASMSRNYRFAPAVLIGFVVFAFFHFLGRQPVFWVALVLISQLIQRPPPKYEAKCVSELTYKRVHT